MFSVIWKQSSSTSWVSPATVPPPPHLYSSCPHPPPNTQAHQAIYISRPEVSHPQPALFSRNQTLNQVLLALSHQFPRVMVARVVQSTFHPHLSPLVALRKAKRYSQHIKVVALLLGCSPEAQGSLTAEPRGRVPQVKHRGLEGQVSCTVMRLAEDSPSLPG
jgi:hypothetical protein